MARRTPLRQLRPSRRIIAATAVAGLALGSLGAGLLLHARHPSDPGATPSRSATLPAPTPRSSVAPSPASAPAEKLIGDPTGDVLVIPALAVQAPLVSVAMSRQKVLTPPSNPREVGYWDASAPPGSSSGQTLITGHTVHTGGGALDRLGALRDGQQVIVYRKQAGDRVVAAYRVTGVRTYSKAELAHGHQQAGHRRARRPKRDQRGHSRPGREHHRQERRGQHEGVRGPGRTGRARRSRA